MVFWKAVHPGVTLPVQLSVGHYSKEFYELLPGNQMSELIINYNIHCSIDIAQIMFKHSGIQPGVTWPVQLHLGDIQKNFQNYLQ